MVVLGAHYLPFVFLYGMRMFAALALILWTGGVLLGGWFPMGSTAGAWFTGAVLLAFALLGRTLVLAEERRES